MIVTAFDLKYYQFSGQPWMDSSLFDVVARCLKRHPRALSSDDAESACGSI